MPNGKVSILGQCKDKLFSIGRNPGEGGTFVFCSGYLDSGLFTAVKCIDLMTETAGFGVEADRTKAVFH